MENHIPVMLDEVIKYLDVKNGKKYIDATLGAGGYTKAILQKGGKVLGIDQDPRAIEIARRHLSVRFGKLVESRRACPDTFKLINSNFSKIGEIARDNSFDRVSGIVFDLGFASFQVEDPKYGLSFQKDGPLDMRLDPSLGVTASDLVNTLSEKHLADLFDKYAEEKYSKKIARVIVSERIVQPIKTTRDLSQIVEKAYGWNKTQKIHSATKVFQALRMAVNTEMDNLQKALSQTTDLLELSGRLVVVSFHSGEDRIVKNFFREQESLGVIKVLTQKPAKPSKNEVIENPRSRSAILRALEKYEKYTK